MRLPLNLTRSFCGTPYGPRMPVSVLPQRATVAVLALGFAGAPRAAWAQSSDGQPAPPTVASPPSTESFEQAPTTPKQAAGDDTPALKVTPLGYVEAHYAYNFNRPSNG